MYKSIVAFALLAALNTNVLANPNDVYKLDTRTVSRNFDNAKRVLAVYDLDSGDRYTGCNLTTVTGKVTISKSNCDYNPKRNNAVSTGVSTGLDHVFPISLVYQDLPCGKSKNPRTACMSVPLYRVAYTDLHNLFFTQEAVNMEKSDHPWCEGTDGHLFGKDGMRLLNKRVVTRYGISRYCVVPPSEYKGDIARLGFYMRDTYNLKFTDAELWMYEQWNTEDPISSAERERNLLVGRIQGNTNTYVE